MKSYIYYLTTLIILCTSCESDFLDRSPADALSPATFWKTENDAKLALTACYDGYEDGSTIFYRDCGSDNAYNHFTWDGYRVIGNGQMSATSMESGGISYGYSTIRRCNDFLENVDNVTFTTQGLKEQYISEVRFLRAYRYFIMNQNYGGVPLVTKVLKTIEESTIPRNTKEEIKTFIVDELKNIIASGTLEQNVQGRISLGAAQALLMRVYLFNGYYQQALETANSITGYELFTSTTGGNAYNNLFLPANELNKEVILEVSYLKNQYEFYFVPFMPNSSGGWSAIVPLQSLVDSYEMANGLTIIEDANYDPSNPFKDRDPRLAATIVYPGQTYNDKLFESVIVNNDDHPFKADNATKSGYNFKKYISDPSDYSDVWDTGRNISVIRYAEVLLTKAEALVELNQITDELYNSLDAIRVRAGMLVVDRVKYATQDKLRELVRRERRVELAYEGVRRFDIIRWGIAKEMMNGKAIGSRQATKGNTTPILTSTFPPHGDRDLNLDGEPFFIENRVFKDYNVYLPIPQDYIDKNPKLTQNKGY